MAEVVPRFKLYRLLEPLLAVRRNATQSELFTVHAGSTVMATEEARQSGFVDALVDGEFVCLFMRDLEERGERVNTAHSQ